MDLSTINWKRVVWPQTLHLNAVRSIAAGLVWAVVVALASGFAAVGWWTVPFWAPIYYFALVPMLALLGRPIARLMGDAGQLGMSVTTLLGALMLVVGDPLVFTLWKLRPEWLPVAKFSPLNFKLVIFVFDEPSSGDPEV